MTPLSADNPIHELKEDALGYAPFAEALAKGIARRPQSEGFVVGVQAQWGMGKTSAVNLTLRSLEQLEHDLEPQRKTAVQWFNPWQFAGIDALAKGYLNQLGAVIAASLDKSLGRKSRKFLEKLAKGGSEFIGGAAALGVVAATGGAAIPIAATVKSGVSGAIGLGSYVADSRTLDNLAAELRADLQRLPHKILIILDDLDRLQPDELKQILTLVKTFGNLPQVTHLLVYDRLILGSLLGDANGPELQGRKLPTFLEKIVQVELDLPPPSRSGILRLINEKINELFENAPGTDDETWYEVWRIAHAHYLVSPRDVIRFVNSLSLIWPGVQGEIYIPDLIGIEILRHFEHQTYELIKRHSEFLTTGNLVGEEERKATAQLIVDSAPEGRRSDVKELLRAMFPVLNKYTTGWGSGSQTSPMLGRRISSPDGFDAFFRYTPVEDEIRIAELSQLIEHLDDEPYLRELFAEKLQQIRSDGSSYAASLLEELTDVIGAQATLGPAILNVLLEYGDDLLKREDYRSEFFFPVANDRRLARLFANILGKLDAGDRFEILSQSLSRPQSGITASAMLVAEAALPYKLIYDTDRETVPSLAENEVHSLGEIVVHKVQQRADDGTLLDAPEPWILLKSWKVFGNAADAKAWTSASLQKPANVTPLALSTMSRISYGKEGTKRGMDKIPDSDLFDVEEMLNAAKNLISSGDYADPNGDIGRFISFVENHDPAPANEGSAEPASA